ncbi:DUF1441 family protein [Pasteurella multocida]|uniref:DUF1441 family protein n=1 Tax=Pasteurella multocida TaxID=747 RepID=UPI000CE767E6|nr:DUF1441 family protein [Pasteurella multocida]NKD99092.1 DUF1441 family protein [Pasteurella multocida]PPE93749.1 terminase [Pasteurella multocida]PPE95016.1 terminase [Pasteurella multocida]HDR0636638.1 DUF1441 family protein [Pasteurella multocida]HDR1239080.1 DUF1441 family protein [Pasteurella multocida]
MIDFLSISKIASISGKDRRTVSARLSGIQPARETINKKEYSLQQLLTLLFEDVVSTDIDKMLPADQLSYWSAQLKKLEYKKREGELCEVSEIAREISVIIKSMLQPQETLADRAEAAGMPIEWVIWLQKEVDKNRNESAELAREDGTDVCESE